MKLFLKIAILTLASLTGAHAMKADRDAPTHIEADRVEMHEKKDFSIYTGNVKITKGSITLRGDTITISNKDGNLHLITLRGEPATFNQQNDLGEEISAQSRNMEYRADNGLLELREEALLVKNKNRFSSAHIIYDTREDIIKAGHDNPADMTQQPPRVQITIQPEKNKTAP